MKYDSEENESKELEEQEEAIEIDDMERKKKSLEDIYENKYKSKELDLICKLLKEDIV